MNALARLLNKVVPDTNGGCWLWGGKLDPKGYGVAILDGRGRRAHRRSWELHRGPIPSGLMVCHKCDVRSCVNPDHLWLGTARQNNDDKIAKGRARAACGEANRNKLRTYQVLEMRRLSDRLGNAELGAAFGVSLLTAWKVTTRRSWTHV